MTGEQLIVLVLIGVAFAVGWAARGIPAAVRSATRSPRATSSVLDDATAAFERCATALTAVVATWLSGSETSQEPALEVFDERLSDMRTQDPRVRERLGEESPMTSDFVTALQALEVVHDLLHDATPGEELDGMQRNVISELVKVVTDARTRFRRSAEIVRALPEASQR